MKDYEEHPSRAFKIVTIILAGIVGFMIGLLS